MPKIYRPLRAMRVYCLDCMCGQSKEVRLCPSEHCALWPYRMGRRPKENGPSKKLAASSRFEQSDPTKVENVTKDAESD